MRLHRNPLSCRPRWGPARKAIQCLHQGTVGWLLAASSLVVIVTYCICFRSYHTLVLCATATAASALRSRVDAERVCVVDVDELSNDGQFPHSTLTKFFRAENKVRKQRWVRFVSVGGGRVAMWHRPPARQVKQLAADGCTMLVTLLAEREKASEVGSAVEDHNMKWLWCPLEGANRALLGKRSTQAMVCDAVGAAAAEVRAGGSICVHCAAGMHRTGVFTYALARRLGLTPDEAMMLLLHIRPITYRGVGAFRIAVGESIHELHTKRPGPVSPGNELSADVAGAAAGGAGAGEGGASAGEGGAGGRGMSPAPAGVDDENVAPLDTQPAAAVEAARQTSGHGSSTDTT